MADMREMPMTKQMASRMLDLPEPFKPVIALNYGSKSGILVRTEYDLKPSITISLMYIVDFFYRVFGKFKFALLRN